MPGRIFEDVPSVCAIPPALLTQPPDGDEDRVALLGGDAVLDRYQRHLFLALRPPKLSRSSTEHMTEMTRQMTLVEKAHGERNFR